ncbi:MAG: DUF1700 domain-containing protein [Firmicutes bacterium]|nr:DUF1700 domain-containing protein [Bacillota bacterium]
MTKKEFMGRLSAALDGLPDRQKALDFYAEMIDDHMDDGMSEEAAVGSMEPVETIRNRTLSETPFTAIVRQQAQKPANVLGTALIVIGFPVWFPLLVAGASVIFSLFAVLLSLLASLFAVVLSLGLGGVAGVVSAIFAMPANPPYAVFAAGAGLILIGLSILMFIPALNAGRGVAGLIKRMMFGIKSVFVRRRAL